MNKTYSQNVSNNLSDLEIETITNFLVRESIEIIREEVDYFFLSRKSMINNVLDLHSLDITNLKELRDKLNQIYTKAEVSLLVQKIEKRIKKELRMAQWELNFNYNLNEISWMEPGYVVPLLREEIKTIVYSTTMAKAVDMAWVKLGAQFVPAAYKKLASKAKVGNLVMATVKASPSDVKADLKFRISKLVEGSLKHYKTQLCREMSSQVYNQIFAALPLKDAVEPAKVQTA